MGFLQDVRYGLRILRKSPGVTALAIITLALGIGANTAIFSLLNGVVLRPLPFPQADRLVSLSQLDARKGPGIATVWSVSYPNFFDWRAQSHSVESMAAYRNYSFTLTGAGQPERFWGALGSAGFFDVLGVKPALGRAFRPEDETPGTRVVVLGDEIWRSRFGAGPNILGRPVLLNNEVYTVIGVMPAGFEFPLQTPSPRLWTTLAIDSEGPTPLARNRAANLLRVVGRLRSGVTLRQARAELDTIAATLARQYPNQNGSSSAVAVVPQLTYMVGDTARALGLLMAAVGCVLLIACVNIANLLLAKSAGRAREIAVRAALGASRGRIVRQLLTESVVLALAGGAAGVMLASWVLALLVRLYPQDIPRLHQVSLDGRVLVLAAIVAIATGVLFGLAPAWHARSAFLAQTLKESGLRGSSEGGRQRQIRSALVVMETALGLLLLVTAGLLVRSFVHLLNTDPGYRPDHVLTFRLDLPEKRYSDAQRVRFYDELLARLRVLPGVTSAVAAFPLPLSRPHLGISFRTEEMTVAEAQRPSADLVIASPGYFHSMGIPLIAGREFAGNDGADSPPVVVINQAFARRYFPNQDPVGKRVVPGFSTTSQTAPWRTIVGVAGDIHQVSLGNDAVPTFYAPYAQALLTGPAVLVRASLPPENLVGQVRAEVAAVDAELPLYDVATLDDYLSKSVARPRFQAFLLAAFAALALLLTAVGLYGVMAYSVAQQTHDIGVRMALGAPLADVMFMVLRRGMILTAAGAALGLVATAGVTRLLREFLYGVGAGDPLTFAGVILLLFAVSLLACYVPARRATRIDPIAALREG